MIDPSKGQGTWAGGGGTGGHAHVWVSASVANTSYVFACRRYPRYINSNMVSDWESHTSGGQVVDLNAAQFNG